MNKEIIKKISDLIYDNTILSSRGYTEHNKTDDELSELLSKYPKEYKMAFELTKKEFNIS